MMRTYGQSQRMLRAVLLVMVFALLAGMMPVSVATGATAGWFDPNWAYRIPITVHADQVDADLVDFPLLITGAGLPSSVFTASKSDGSDIGVTAVDGTTPLKRELVVFNPVDQRMELYVRIPLLASTSDTTLYLYFGNPSAALNNDADTWNSDYVMVQHMNDLTPMTIRDSTTHQFVGEKGNVASTNSKYQVNPTVEQDGLVGKAQRFNYSWINVGVHPEFNLRTDFTVEVLARPTNRAFVYNSALVSHDMLATGRQWDAPILMDGRLTTFQVQTNAGERRVHGLEPVWDEWNHVATVYNDTTMALFLNGTKYATASFGPLRDIPNTPLVIGTHYKLNWENHPSFFGLIDEVRISNVDRSDAWIQAGRRNLTAPSSFYSAGAVEENSPVTTVSAIARVDADPTNAGTVSFAVTFADDVSGLTAANFELAPTGSLSGALITTITGSGTGWTVSVNTGSGDGTLGLNLVNDTGLSLGLANLPFTGEVYTIDKTPPVVSVTGVADGAVYTVGSVPAAGCDTQDALSGVQTAATLSMSGSSEVGTVTATCAGALDYAGNAGMATATYQVHYPFNGFFPPVDNVPAVNLVNAGQAIAVKFSLDGDRGLDLFLAGYPASQSHVCGGSEALGPVEPAATPGKSSLTYDAVSDQYTFVWKTEKIWSGTCRQFLLGLKDGAAHTAEFQFQFKGKGVHGAAVDDVSGMQNEHVFLPLITR